MMNEIQLDKPTAEHLAAVIAAIRPDWETRGTVKALGDVRERPVADTAIAAILAALKPDNRTPAVIALAGDHWTRAAKAIAPDADRTPGSIPIDQACAQCGNTRSWHTVAAAVDHPYESPARNLALIRAENERRTAAAEAGEEWSPTAVLDRYGMDPQMKNATLADVRAKNQAFDQRAAEQTPEPAEGATA